MGTLNLNARFVKENFSFPKDLGNMRPNTQGQISIPVQTVDNLITGYGQ